MNIIVCVKAIPYVSEYIKLREDKKDIHRTKYVYKINDTDNNALEEALRIKEKIGGKVTVISISPKEEEDKVREILWECLAKGADHAIHIVDDLFKDIDSLTTAKIASKVIKNLSYDLILTGSEALDDNLSVFGPALAKFLNIPYSTLVVNLEFKDKDIIVHRELDEGYKEVVKLKLPALLSIQSGINEPRYVSLLKVMRAKRKPIEVLTASDLGITSEDLSNWKMLSVEKVEIPVRRRANIISGSLDEIASSLAKLIHEIIHGG